MVYNNGKGKKQHLACITAKTEQELTEKISAFSNEETKSGFRSVFATQIFLKQDFTWVCFVHFTNGI